MPPEAITRQQLKEAMLAMFLEQDKKKKAESSKRFTNLLFSFVKIRMKGMSAGEISESQMEAVGLFGQYVLGKNGEKSGQKQKSAEETLREIASESDILFDEIESRLRKVE